MAIVEMYGTKVEFDLFKQYAGYTSGGQLGKFLVENTLRRISLLGSKEEAVKKLEAIVNHFQDSTEKRKMLESMVEGGIISLIAPIYLADGMGGRDRLITPKQEEALQNSIGLLTNVAKALRA